ncbi:plasmodesmata-located protein 8 [Lolium perenne]|uniref:plasmodesmata-located protein 8 n=1 Tax=Lolium perenne TaxID=4522 RepID=UPI0021F61051|nr:plasmodesmata-located protein 8-like [Lolium perenne]
MPLLGSYVATMLVLLLHLRAAPTATVHAAIGTFVYAGCSPSKYERNTAFENNLNSLLTSISSTASSGATYNSFTAGGGDAATAAADSQAAQAASTATTAYGLYQCRGDLSPGDCAACVRETAERLGAVCANSYAASLQADGCYVRYGATDFVGRADNTVAYRKCSSGASEDAGFLKSRDGVLRQLQAQAATGYKLVASSTVEGVAQCLGDIKAADCAACLAEAVVQLKGACGSALAADVYLEQCYVKYWANGHDFRSSQDYSGDEFGKTVAIIVGVLAGLALLVVFISFLTKAC